MSQPNVVSLAMGRGSRGGGANAGNGDLKLEGIRALGYDHGVYWYLSPETEQIEALAAGEHSEANLCRLRPLSWWEEAYPPPTKVRTKFDLSAARQALMAACHAQGVFNPELVRGRGVWWDAAKGVGVLHEGQWVRSVGAEGKAKAWRPSDAPGPHIYESAGAWGELAGDPLDDDDGARLLELVGRLGWAEPIYARLLCGWAVVAPVCGALRWRPHLAITGPREAGKSFVVTEILVPLLGQLGMHVLGETTAAGIRQDLARDARPIVWDEAEPQGRKGSARLEEAMALARHLSSSGGGRVIKGGANHKAQSFAGVACMCLVSIFVQLLRDADASRVTVLEMRNRVVDQAQDRITRQMVEGLDADFAKGLLARTLAHLGVLRASHDLFAAAVAQRHGSQRLGDQLGALLAGAHLLVSTDPPTAEEAAEAAAELPLACIETPASVSDEQRCLQRLATWQCRVDTAGGKRQVTRSVGELVRLAIMKGGDDEIGPPEAGAVLGRLGVRVKRIRDPDNPGTEAQPIHDPQRSEVAVAAHHDRLADIWRDTDFASGWGRMLERLPGARRSSAPVRFGPGAQSRATVVPGALFLDPSGNEGGTNGTDSGTA